jgi:hypothetical protein
VRDCRIQRDMQSGRKIGAADHNHEESVQMMSGFGYRLIDGPNIGRRRGRNSLGMCMPVTDKMQSFPVHFVDLSLFFASVGKV